MHHNHNGQHSQPTIALLGQPNTGKSTLFNSLTGMQQAVSNWPGRTVEKKLGQCQLPSLKCQLIDLPGCYSLSACSAEEQLSRDYLLQQQYQLIVVIANAANLSRTLYTLTEAMALQKPLLLVINMIDSIDHDIDCDALAANLNVPVVAISAKQQLGVEQLKQSLEQALTKPSPPATLSSQLPWLPAQHLPTLQRVIDAGKPLWPALQMLEQPHQSELISARYHYLQQLIKTIPTATPPPKLSNFDRLVTHPIAGPALLLGLFIVTVTLGLVAGITFGDLLRSGIDPLQQWLEQMFLQAKLPLLGWIVSGVVRGVGAVLAVIPVVAVFSAIFAILEDSGYLARAAYVMDRTMNRIGLNGRVFVALLFSIPCTIIGALSARLAESERQRMLTLLLLPMVPCSAKLTISTVIALWFFPPATAVAVVVMLFLVNLLILALICRLFDHILFGLHQPTPLILELPRYQWPQWRSVATHAYNRSGSFVKKATTILVAFSALISFACYFPGGEINSSLLGLLGQQLTPIAQLMGGHWQMLTILFASLLNKEAMLATAAVVYQLDHQGIRELMAAQVSSAGALAFMFAQNVFLPCFAALGAIYAEAARRYLVTGLIVLYTSVLSIGGGIVLYQLLHALN